MGPALRYLISRLLRAALTVAGVVLLVFLLVRLVPGDPVDAILGDQASPEDRASLRRSLALDRPLPQQLARFAGDLADGTLGHSFRRADRTVSSLLLEVAPDTATLALAAWLFALALAIPLGTLAAARRGTAWDRFASWTAVAGLAVPTIVLGPLLVLVFSVKLRWLPLPGDDLAGSEGAILPVVTVGAALAAILARQTRAAVAEVAQEPFVTAARARGLGEVATIVRHALRCALVPILTVAAAQLGALLSGTVVAEKIFERPGLGTLFLEAFFARDIPVVQGCVLAVATVWVAVNLLLDFVYVAIDPRVRLG